MIRSQLFACLPAVSALALAGCAAESHTDLTRETAALVERGMLLGEASTALSKAGYHCGPSQLAGDEPQAIACSRERLHRIITTCVQHIDLVPSSDGARVEAVKVREPSCAGV